MYIIIYNNIYDNIYSRYIQVHKYNNVHSLIHIFETIDIDECVEGLDTCGDEICYNQPGGYSCATPPAPITRKPSTTALPAPGNNQRCIDGTRYVRNRGCVDINECRELKDACSSNEECINTIGSYMCTCKTGFRRDNLTQACVDINECQLQVTTMRCNVRPREHMSHVRTSRHVDIHPIFTKDFKRCDLLYLIEKDK